MNQSRPTPLIFVVEQYRPMQTIFSMATVGASVKLGGFVTSTSSPYLNTLNSGLLGGTVSYVNTSFTNAYYNETKDPLASFGIGAFFGIAGYRSGYSATNFLSTRLTNPSINRNAPMVYQNYINPRADYIGNTGLGTVVSNISSFIETPDKKK